MKHGVLACLILVVSTEVHANARRAVVIKVDGLPRHLLADFVQQREPSTGKSRLPWIEKVFFQDGAWVKNFYVRGVSVSAPSWQMLDTGRHLVIRGNAEFDRYTLRSYDYLNFFPFYLKYARSKSVDTSSVEALDRAGVPLLIDQFAVSERYQGFQLFQRGVRWKTLESMLRRRFTSRSLRELFNEWQSGLDLRNVLNEQIERELLAKLQDERIAYLDYFTAEFDHLAHLDNNPESHYAVLKELDRLVGRIQAGIERSPLARETVFVLLSDHGMNTSPEVFSQGYNLVKFFGSATGGGHHVLTNRHPLEGFKVRGLYPFVSKVITPSEESLYLSGQHAHYPTALLDLDGNERASVYLRSNRLNRIHVLMRELKRKDLDADERGRFALMLLGEIHASQTSWRRISDELAEELHALLGAITRERQAVAALPDKKSEEARRRHVRIEDWSKAATAYRDYRRTLLNLLSLDVGRLQPGRFRIEDFILPGAMGDVNTIHDLQNYITGLDGEWFRTVNYFAALTAVRTRNNVQEQVGNRPLDFIAVRVPGEAFDHILATEDPSGADRGPASGPEVAESSAGLPAENSREANSLEDGVWLYGEDQHQALILRRRGWLRYLPVAGLTQDPDGKLRFSRSAWNEGFPLQLWEDRDLQVSGDRAAWLNAWHTEREWLRATHRTRYSSAVIGLAEHFARRPAPQGNLVARFEDRRLKNTEADLLIVASDGWNFNVRGFNPGGNHGSFLRLSTLSTLLIAGADIPRGLVVEEPYDSLSFAPTLLRLLGRVHDSMPGPCIEELFAPR